MKSRAKPDKEKPRYAASILDDTKLQEDVSTVIEEKSQNQQHFQDATIFIASIHAICIW